MKIAVVGATGLVGSIMLKVLEEQYKSGNIPGFELIPVASANSVGKKVVCNGVEYTVCSIEDAIQQQPALAIFSAGSTTSLNFAEKFAAVGTTVIDNSSAWRMKKNIPLVVPEVNAFELTAKDKIIANPNCSTIQMVLALAPLHRSYGIKRLVISTYQSVTGSGVKAVKQLYDERAGLSSTKVYPHRIDMNVIPHGGDFLEDGYTSEEQKLIDETRKILDAPEINITATVVRVPLCGGHSESVNVEMREAYDLEDVRRMFTLSKGLILRDNPAQAEYPMPYDAEGKDDVFVGRIRRDFSVENGLNMWIVADNLRKGAATNAVQIAAYLIENKLV